MSCERNWRWAAALSLALTGGCEQKHVSAGATASASPAPALSRGERVVVEETAAHFYEGRVLEVDGDQVRVEPIAGGASKRIALTEAYPIARSCERCDSGLAICRVKVGSWAACRIEASLGTKRRVRIADGRSMDVDRSSILAPSAFTALNLERHFEKMRAQREYLELAARQHDPRPPQGFRPTPRGRVVAKLGQRWLSATVQEIEEKSIHVRFVGSERNVELEKRWVLPEPPHSSLPLRGSFVLLRPTLPAGEWERWRVGSAEDAAKVQKRDGDALVVVNAAGTTRHVTRADVIPLPRVD